MARGAGGSLIFGGLEKNLNYGQGAGDFEGATYFGKSPMGGTYFWRKILRLSGKNKTKNFFFENIFLGGTLF